MDVGVNTLLVAIMFVTILAMGIGNLLIALADILNHASSSRRDRVHLAWIVLMLLVHFNLFWHTKVLMEVADWRFGAFLLTIAGPVLLFFATCILLTAPESQDSAQLRAFFVRLGRRFFLLLALLQVWILAVAYSITGSFAAADLLNAAFLVLALVLAMSSSGRVQVAGVWLAGLLSLASLIRLWMS